MKSLLVIIDGLGDEQIPALGGKTPFTYAPHHNIDKIATEGTCGSISICETDFVPESLGCILRLLGVAPQDFPTNRAYLELLAHQRDISEYEMVLRCNLVTVDANGKLTAFNAQGLTPAAMEAAATCANKLRKDIEFLHLSAYRNLLILDKNPELLRAGQVAPPHESMGRQINELLAPMCAKSLLLNQFIKASTKALDKFAQNGQTYQFYPWGASERIEMRSFEERQHLRGGAVCAAEIVQGIALALKLEQATLARATGEVDTDVVEKAEQAFRLLAVKDFVMVHFNGTDEAAHRKNPLEKAAFISRIDREFFGQLLPQLTEPTRIVVCGDHGTSSLTGKHLAGKVPIIAGTMGTTTEQAPEITKYQEVWQYLFERS